MKCKKCNSNNTDWTSKKDFERGIQTKIFKCYNCNNGFSFDEKWKPSTERPFGEYVKIKGQTYMRSNKIQDFVEVVIIETRKGYLQVCPINKVKKNKIIDIDPLETLFNTPFSILHSGMYKINNK